MRVSKLTGQRLSQHFLKHNHPLGAWITSSATAIHFPLYLRRDVAQFPLQRRMTSNAKTVAEYLVSLPEDRRNAISTVRKVILANLPKGYEEIMQYGMIGYVVPHRLYPAGYPANPALPLGYASLGSQKNHMALYAMCAYGDPATMKWLQQAFKAAGKRLDMGKACLRFKKLDDLPLDIIGQLIARVPVKNYIARVEQVLNRKPKKRGT
jgi:hypothetical protein